jgi:two-component system, response regulator PdtaR
MPGMDRLAAPRFWPVVVFTRDDASAVDKDAPELPRIMIVEDDYLIASEIEVALAEAGFDVAGVASSADEAIELAASKRPALAVMDVRLSGPRDGIYAALELFERHGIRCIFATAHHNSEARMRAQPANPLGWIAKPYPMSSLVTIVRRVVRDLEPDR